MDLRKKRRIAALAAIIFTITGEAQKRRMRFLEEFYNETKRKRAYLQRRREERFRGLSRGGKADGKTSVHVKSEEEGNDSGTRKFCMVEHKKGTCECMKLVPPSLISDKESSGEASKITKNSGKKSAQSKASKSDKEKSESILPEFVGAQSALANLPIIKCSYCDQPFKYKANLVKHEQFVHGIVRKEPKRKQAHILSSYKCKICSATYKTVVNLSKHLRKHDGDHEFRCKTCGVSLKGKDLIKFHVSSSRRKVLNRCSICRAESKKNPKIKVGTESDDGGEDPQFILGKKIPEEQIQALEENDHMGSVLTNLKRDPTEADVLTIKHEPVDPGIKEEIDHNW